MNLRMHLPRGSPAFCQVASKSLLWMDPFKAPIWHLGWGRGHEEDQTRFVPAYVRGWESQLKSCSNSRSTIGLDGEVWVLGKI